MTRYEECVAELSEHNENAILLDDLEDALIGMATNKVCGECVAVYDFDRIVEILMSRDQMSYMDAVDYVSFNVEGAYFGEHTPLILHRFSDVNVSIDERQ